MDELGLKNLVKNMQNGDMSSFDVLFNETKKLIFYNIYQITKSYEVSEDLMQDTYVKFLDTYKELDTNKSITGFFMTVSRNIAINYVKKASRMSDLTDIEFKFNNEDTYNTDEEELLRRIYGILNKKQFEIFILHLYGEMTFAEISKAKKIPQNTVIWYYNSGIKKLRKELAEYEAN